jgi:hypothetical protein
MKMFEAKLVFKKLDDLKKLIKYYGGDCPVCVVISSNICPNDQYKLRERGRMYK